MPQPQITYSTWQNGLEYAEPTTTNSMATWTRPTYVSTYPLPEVEVGAHYGHTTQACMLLEPDPTTGGGINYVGGPARGSQHSIWFDHMNSVSLPQQNTHALSAYPLTPTESQKSYSVIGNSGSGSLGTGKPLSVANALTLPSTRSRSDFDTPPLSATSHRSSNGWHTETASTSSQGSSRASCSETQELLAARAIVHCAAQDVSNHYTSPTSPPLNVPASALPIASAPAQSEQYPALVPLQISDIRESRDRASQSSLRATSPSGVPLLGYSYTSVNGSGRRSLISRPATTRPLAGGITYMWSPSTMSRSSFLSANGDVESPEEQSGSNVASVTTAGSSSSY